MHYATSFLLSFTLLAILLYWTPLVGCAIGYTLKSIEDFKADRQRLAHLTASRIDAADNFKGELTIGVLLGRLFATVCPLWNVIAWIFDLQLSPFGRFLDWLRATFTFSLVRGPARKT
jgi:hypothetical protein